MNKVLFDASDTTLQNALRERVDAYFAKTGLSRHANAHMVRKTVFFIGGAVLLWALLVSALLPAWAAAVVCLGFGVMLAGIGFNVGHDAIHGAYSKRPWVNHMLSHTFDVIGASSFTWSVAHNFVHHTYTNVPGVDHDLDPGPWMLFHRRENPAFLYRFQHIYAFFFYCFTTIVWTFRKDFVQVFAPDPRTGKRAPTAEIVKLFAWKVVHLALFIAVPLVVGGYAWWQILVGYLLMHAAVGVTLAIVFQLAHVVENTQFPEPDAARKMGTSWAAHQLATTANFAPDSYAANFFCGGLNHQVEHHLFAKICHVHYPALAPIVRDVAREYGAPYHVNPTFLAALASHLRMMKSFGAGAPLVLPALTTTT